MNKYKIWDDYGKVYVWDAVNDKPMEFDTVTAADTYIDDKLWDYYADKPIAVFQIR